MKAKYLYITSPEWFERGVSKNPIMTWDIDLESAYPDFFERNYDIRLLAVKAPTEEELYAPFYNDYREKYGNPDISAIDEAINGCTPKNVFLNGFKQEQFDYIVPLIKDTSEVLYLFKCPKIKDLSALSDFPKLQCVFIFWNNSLETLWDMKCNTNLKIISFMGITNLKNIDSLAESAVEYVNLDSAGIITNRKEMLFDSSVFNEMSNLKHLKLNYKKSKS